MTDPVVENSTIEIDLNSVENFYGSILCADEEGCLLSSMSMDSAGLSSSYNPYGPIYDYYYSLLGS